MLLLLGRARAAARSTARASSQLAELDQRLDELRRDREDARLVDALALRVLPDRAEALGRRAPARAQQRGDPARPQGLEPVPARAGRLRARRAPRAAQCSASSGGPRRREQRAAALVHRPDQHSLGRLGPLVEQRARGLPVADAQLELAQVEAQQRVRVRLAALVGERAAARSAARARAVDLAAPDEPLARDPLGRRGHVGRRVRGGAEPLAEVVDRRARGALRAQASA